MSGITTSTREDAHAYTRSDTPWILDGQSSAYGKLVKYLSGGGLRAFGRTVRQEEIRRRRFWFWASAVCFGTLWLAFWIF